MNAQKSQTFSTEQEKLKALADIALHPQDFMRVDYKAGKESFTSYVCREPLKASSDLSYQGRDYVNSSGVIVNLNLPKQVYLNELISKKFGIPVRHGSLREQLAAAHSGDTGYREKVQIPYWVFTGQVLRELGETYEVRNAVGTEFVRQTKPADTEMLVELDGKLIQKEEESEKIVPKLRLGPVLQKNVSIGSGYYPDFSSEVPTSSELGEKNKESKGRFGGVYSSNQGLSAVVSGWYSVDGVLVAYAYVPLLRYDYGVSGVWTDKNPKK